jgi:UDP-glucose 4-epimerase
MPGNLLPYILWVAVGRLNELQVFGGDYPTPDGSGIRDYIHVVDLAQGHLRALEALESKMGAHIWNLGTGRGYSVLELIQVFESESGQSVPYRLVSRRDGDVAISYADPTKALNELGWIAKRDLAEMMRDAWRWQSLNPTGYS